jgi:type I restriction enzyme S subunit
VRRGDLLVCEGGVIGRCAIWHGREDYLAFQKALHRVRPGDAVDARFLRYLLEHHSVSGVLARLSTGTTIAHLPQQQLRRVPVPLPPLDEQRRIVDLLEDHLSRLDAADAYLSAGRARARLWRARFIDRLVWSADLPRAEVWSVLREPMRNGRSDRAVQGSAAGTRTLTLTAVTKNSFTDENTKLTTTTPDRARGLWLEPSDVFVQRSNTPDLVGTTARYDGPRDWAIFPDLLIRLRADESVVDSRFLAVALGSEQGHAQLRERAKGAAGSMPKIDQEAIGRALIPLPSRDEQRAILALAEEAETGLRRLCAQLDAAQIRSSGLRRSLLAAAFSGRLTAAGADLSDVEATVAA